MPPVTSNLRLRPVPDDTERSDRDKPAAEVKIGKLRAVFVWIALPVLLGLIGGSLTKLALVKLRYVQARGEIRVVGVDGDQLKAAVGRGLGNLNLSSITIKSGDDYRSVTLAELVAIGRLKLFASDDGGITIVAEDKTARGARGLVERIQASYTEWSDRATGRQSKETAAMYKQGAFRQKSLQNRHAQLRKKVAALEAETSSGGALDDGIVKLGRQLETSLPGAQTLNERLAEIHDQIVRAEVELRRPTITISSAQLRRSAMADPMFAGEYVSLQKRHKKYLSTFRQELAATEKASAQLRGRLEALVATVSKQLLLDLPNPLADDLMELKLAGELYNGQMDRYVKRWQRYRAKMLEFLADADRADYNAVQTLLSQLRQDLTERCGELPKQLSQLFDRLRAGPKTDARKPGSLSGVTLRNIASSGAQYDLDRTLGGWRKLVWQVDRLFPEKNVQLNTLGRFCERIRRRMTIRQRRTRQDLERQLVATAKSEARTKLTRLRSDFYQSSVKLAEYYKTIMADQRRLCGLTQRWPQWQQLHRQMDKLTLEMEVSARELSEIGAEYWPEELQCGPVTIQRLTHAGLAGEYDSATSAGIGGGLSLVSLLAVFVFRRRCR